MMDELVVLLREYKEQLSSLQVHLKANPDDDDAKELCAELSEAIISAESAYAACFNDSDPKASAHPQLPSSPGGNTHYGSSSSPGEAPKDDQLRRPTAHPNRTQHESNATHQSGTTTHDEHHAPGSELEPHRQLCSQPQPQQQQQQLLQSSAQQVAASNQVGTSQHASNPASQQQQSSSKRRKLAAMHPANIYASSEPDFAALAAAHPPLAPHMTYPDPSAAASSSGPRRPSIDFASWSATKELTAALLKVDFSVNWDLPVGQLVPPVPNRANYIHWMADLLQLSSPPAGGPVIGLDIGCGANLIYCLLGAAIYGWRMVGVDVTDVALSAAQQLLQANPHLQHLLEVRKSTSAAGADFTPLLQQPHDKQQQQQQGVVGPLMGAVAAGDGQQCFHFCMCNPPFFESMEEANQNPNTACGGTAAEMVVPGGELVFVRAMIADSLTLQGRCHWYSSMCGKKATMKVLRQELHAAGATAVRTTELVQGRTSRWAIAWSFTVPASTANTPLPRASRQKPTHDQQQQQQREQQQQEHQHKQMQQQQQRTRQRQQQQQQQQQQQVSFTLSAAAAEGRTVLQALAALLSSECGATQLQLDIAKWCIRCHLPIAPAAAAAVVESPQPQTTLAAPTAAAAAAGEPGQQLGGGGAVSRETVAAVEVSVFQQRKVLQVVGKFITGAAGRAGAGESQSVEGAAELTAVFDKLKADLALMWTVSD